MKRSIPNPLSLYLIRHGETEWSLNFKDRLGGLTVAIAIPVSLDF